MTTPGRINEILFYLCLNGPLHRFTNTMRCMSASDWPTCTMFTHIVNCFYIFQKCTFSHEVTARKGNRVGHRVHINYYCLFSAKVQYHSGMRPVMLGRANCRETNCRILSLKMNICGFSFSFFESWKHLK